MGYWTKKRTWRSVRQAHASGGLITEIDADAEEICWASGFTSLATNAIFRTGRGGDLTSFTAIPGHHFEYVQRTGTNTLGATDAGVVDLDGVGHESLWEQVTWYQSNGPWGH